MKYSFTVRYLFNPSVVANGSQPSDAALAEMSSLPTLIIASSMANALAAISALNPQYTMMSGIQQNPSIVSVVS